MKVKNRYCFDAPTVYLSYVVLVLLMGYFIVNIMTYICDEFDASDPKLAEIRLKLEKLSPVVKKLKFFRANKSFTINKKRIHLCLKDENGQYYPDNMLMYVAIHELAHVLCKDIGHTQSFYDVFEKLIAQADELKIYDKSIPILKDYCGYRPGGASDD